MKYTSLSIALLAAAVSASAQIPYKVTVPIPDVEEGTIAYMINYDTGETIDSVAVTHQKALFTGDIDDPIMARAICDGRRYGTFVLEQGSAAVNQEKKVGVGSMLNDQLVEMIDQLDAIAENLQNAQSQAEAEKYYNQYLQTERQMIEDNLDSPIGYYLFVDYATSVDAPDMLALVETHPELKDYRRVQNLIEGAKHTLATSVGQPFVDFEVTYDGVTHKLSDYVGHGDYVLVDFWASWCGPCRREIKTLKEIYNEYGPKGLKVLGVAVWDKPADTLAAIKQLDIPWECIIDAQTIPTDLYGIPGIPCIILFGPDGKILSRGLQGEALKAEVAKYFAK